MSREPNWRWRQQLAVPGPGTGALYCPPVYGVVGKVCHIHMDTILTADGQDTPPDVVGDYTWSVWCPGGGGLVGVYWEWTPTAAGTWPIVVRQYDGSGNLLGSATTSIVVVPDSPAEIRVATFGGSNTQLGKWMGPLNDLASDWITWVGLAEGHIGLMTDAVPGWSAEVVMTYPESALVWDGVYDPARYLQELGEVPDVVTIWFGTNRVATKSDATWLAAADDEVSRVEQMVADFLSLGVPVVVLAIPSPGNAAQAAWTDNYAGEDWEPQFRWEVRHRYITKRMTERWKERESERIIMANTSTEVDPANGYPVDNALHPVVELGGTDMARAFYAAYIRAGMRIA